MIKSTHVWDSLVHFYTFPVLLTNVAYIMYVYIRHFNFYTIPCVTVFYTRFISCSLLSCITLRMTQLAIYHYTKQNKLK